MSKAPHPRTPQPLYRRLKIGLYALSGLGLLSLLAGYLLTAHAASGRLYERLEQVPARSVAIVLGAKVYANDVLSDVVSDRVACAAALYHAGRVKRVLVSGDHGRSSYDEVSAMGRALMREGVPASRLFLDHAGFRTLDTMHRARDVFGVRDAVVCTQRFHQARSLYLAQSFGIDAVGLVADRRRYRGHLYNAARESLARTAAVLDRTLGRKARMLGPPIALSSDGRLTHEP